MVDCIRAFWNWYLLFSLKYYSRVGLNTKSTRLHFCASTNASAILESFQFSCRANMYFLKLHLFLYMTRLFLGFFSHLGVKARECVRVGAAGAQTRRTLGHHLLHPLIPLILKPLVLCAPAVLRSRALQDAPAPADPNS